MGWKKIFGFGKKRDALGDDIVKEMGFSHDVLDIIKHVSNNNYQHLTVRNLYNEGEIEVEGISFSTSKNEAEKLVIQLQSKLRPLEYSVFISEHTNNKICKIGVIKGNDQFEILKIQQTNGDNYDIGNDDVIDKLKEWNGKYPFTIIGADYDWVEAHFKVIPNDIELKSFAQEIYEFCPDIVGPRCWEY